MKGPQEKTDETDFPDQWDLRDCKGFKGCKVLRAVLDFKVSKGHRECKDHKGRLVSPGFKVIELCNLG